MSYYVRNRNCPISAGIVERTDGKDWPWVIWKEHSSFAFGVVVALFHKKEEADKVCSLLNRCNNKV